MTTGRAIRSDPANQAILRLGSVQYRRGAGRTGAREFLQHLSIANGSLCEGETHIRLAGRFGYRDDGDKRQLLAAVAQAGRPLSGVIRRYKPSNPWRPFVRSAEMGVLRSFLRSEASSAPA